jgi:hypothetical protein
MGKVIKDLKGRTVLSLCGEDRDTFIAQSSCHTILIVRPPIIQVTWKHACAEKSYSGVFLFRDRRLVSYVNGSFNH